MKQEKGREERRGYTRGREKQLGIKSGKINRKN